MVHKFFNFLKRNRIKYSFLSIFLIISFSSCKPEDSNQYMGKYQFSGPPAENKLLWNILSDGEITTTPIATQVWTPVEEESKKIKFLKMQKNNIFILWGTSKGILYNFDHKLAKIKWSNSYSSSILSTPSLSEDKAFFGLENGYFYSVDVLTGKELWSFPSSGSITTNSSIDETSIFYGTKNGIFYCIDKDTGKPKWEKSIKNEINSSSLVYKNNVYFGSDDGNIYALDKLTGTIKWNFATKGKIISMPVAYSNKIYIVSQDKNCIV